jgi:hypothetical protein
LAKGAIAQSPRRAYKEGLGRVPPNHHGCRNRHYNCYYNCYYNRYYNCYYNRYYNYNCYYNHWHWHQAI